MSLEHSEYLKLKNSFENQHILVVGDVMLDRYVWGSADRVSEEAPVLVVDVDKKDERLGGAGNVVNNLISLGVEVSLAAVVGADFYGEQIQERLKKRGVNAEGVFASEDRPTTTKKRVIARGQQVLRIDYEKKHLIDALLEDRLIAHISENLDRYNAVIISDYAKGTITPKILELFSEQIKAGKIGLGKCPVTIDPKPANQEFYQGLNVIKPNRKEVQEITGVHVIDLESAKLAAKKVHENLNIDLVLLSLGPDGIMVYSKEQADCFHFKTLEQKVFDVSGAGDAVVSCFTAALAAGFDFKVATDFANLGGASVVSEVGTVPVSLEKIEGLLNGS